MGVDDWDAARVLAGRPRRGAELSEQHNPLEAGLYGAVSLNKGCYIGQVGVWGQEHGRWVRTSMTRPWWSQGTRALGM